MIVSSQKSLGISQIALTMVWFTLVIYAFFLAPPDQPEITFNLIKNLTVGNWEGINPLIISLFNLMGIWPLIYGCVIFADGQGQKIPAWLFAIASFAVGAFAILPYLVWRKPNPEFSGVPNLFIRIWDSKFTALVLMLGAIVLVFYGITQGDWRDFIYQWQNSRFIHVMSLDFCLLSVLFPALLGDDIARRGNQAATWLWLVTLIPLFGPLLYLCVRSPLCDRL
ncbi:DUF2834 domain-containing protein [Limnospira platensis CENA597]|uniref:DUF2834 domain-containing protein n=1 Tax=Limnospira platensis TaxID=118562 RepID=UPI003D6E7C5E